MFASVLNLINEKRLLARKKPVGFVNPVLYANPQVFNDITRGSNPGCGTNGFTAVPGWDPVTGLGCVKTAFAASTPHILSLLADCCQYAEFPSPGEVVSESTLRRGGRRSEWEGHGAGASPPRLSSAITLASRAWGKAGLRCISPAKTGFVVPAAGNCLDDRCPSD